MLIDLQREATIIGFGETEVLYGRLNLNYNHEVDTTLTNTPDNFPFAARRTAKSLTVISPFYNEEAGVRAYYEELRKTLDSLSLTIEFVFVDDGSFDNTLAILNEIADADPRVTVLSLSRNFGHQIALTAGMDHANGDVAVTMDSDLQHPPQVIMEMITLYQAGFDVVYGVRRQTKKLGYLKRLSATLYYALLRRMANIEVLRGAADFRLTSREVITSLRQMRELHRYLRGMVPWVGFNATHIYFDQPERFAGSPGYTWRKSMRLARHGMFSFSTIPLEFITWLGIGMTVLSMVYLIYTLFITATGQALAGWTSTIVVSLAIGGVQLISLGILAQYIGMIFEQVKGRPLYFLKQTRLAGNSLAQLLRDDTQQRGTQKP